MIFLLEQVKLAWELKQKQLKELATILTHENYTETGLATGNDSLADTCKGLDEYIDNANKTAWHEEKRRKRWTWSLRNLNCARTKLTPIPVPVYGKSGMFGQSAQSHVEVDQQTELGRLKKMLPMVGNLVWGQVQILHPVMKTSFVVSRKF